MLKLILETIWLLLPAGVANTVPVFAAKYNWFPAFNRPISQRFLGAHKTWRGVAAGIIFGSITGVLLGHGAIFGAILGAGALAGDAVKSFFKRLLKIAPGKPWPVFDQIDSVVGALAIAWFFIPITYAHAAIAIIIFGPISFLVSYLGVKLKIKNSL